MRRLVLLALLLPLLATAAPVVRTVTLAHRPADEVAAILRPLTDNGVAIVATGNQLLLRGEASQVDPLVQAIGKLDVAPPQLLLTIRQGGRGEQNRSGGSITGSAAQPELRVYATRDRDRPETTQQVRSSDGQWTHVAEGIAFPVINQSATVTPSGTTLQQNTEYKEVQSGFDVMPRVTGRQVTLTVRTYRGALARHDGGRVESAELETTVRGALGEWIELGGTVEHRQRDAQGTIYATHERGQQLGRTQIKVELLP